MKSKGFISISIIYSFFLVFISVSTILLANYVQNRTLIETVSNDIKNELLDIGNANSLRLENLITNGNFDPISDGEDEWLYKVNGITKTLESNLLDENEFMRTSKNYYVDSAGIANNYTNFNYSLGMGMSETNSYTISRKIKDNKIVNKHTYYIRYYFMTPYITQGISSTIKLSNTSGQNIYYPNLETLTQNIEPNPIYPEWYSKWHLFSEMVKAPDTLTSSNWSFSIDEVQKIGSPSYLDDIMIIDVTEAIKDPNIDKNWFDENLSYFEGIKTFNKEGYDTIKP